MSTARVIAELAGYTKHLILLSASDSFVLLLPGETKLIGDPTRNYLGPFWPEDEDYAWEMAVRHLRRLDPGPSATTP